MFKLQSVVIQPYFSRGVEIAVLLTLVIITASLFSERHIRRDSAEKIAANWVLTLFFTLIAVVSCALVRDHFVGLSGYETAVLWLEYACYVLEIAAAFFLSMYIISDLRKSVYIHDSTSYVLAFFCGTVCILWTVGFLQENNWFLFYTAAGELSIRTAFAAAEFIPAALLFFDFMLILSCGKLIPKERLRSWACIIVTPVTAAICRLLVRNFPSEAISAIAGVVLYVSVYINKARQIELSQKELTESKASLMVSQIQPHFIYNSLNTIYYLIEQDAEQAQEAVSRFSDYLRQNINSLKDDRPVRFEEELSHLDAYLYLEKLRFGDELRIEKNIAASNFYLPPLSVQPLVENAIKHGVSRKEGGGTVQISAFETDDAFVITINDDGVGFEAGKFRDSADTHIGLFNVNSRLKNMCSGTLSVTSKVNVGTSCVITLPKSGQPAAKTNKNGRK